MAWRGLYIHFYYSRCFMFFGSIPALVTPFCDGKVDVRAFRAFVEWQISNHSQALVPCGTTGEGVTLELDEHKLVVETCINQAQGRVPVIAGAGSNATHRAVILAQIAKQAGADAVLVAAPWYTNRANKVFWRILLRSIRLVFRCWFTMCQDEQWSTFRWRHWGKLQN